MYLQGALCALWAVGTCARALRGLGALPGEREALPGGEELFLERALGHRACPRAGRGGGRTLFLSVG